MRAPNRVHLLLALVALASTARADVVSLSHTGYALDALDAPLDRSVGMRFRLFSGSNGGTALWTASAGTDPCAVVVSRGYYAVTLGASGGCGTGLTSAIIASSATLFLEVELDGVVLSPRQPLLDAPRSALAATASVANGLSASVLSTLVARADLGAVPLPATGTPDGTTFLRGDGKWMTPPAYTLPAATASALGGVKSGSGVSIAADGTLSVTPYALPLASASTLGGVKIGSGVSLAGDGTISVSGYTLPSASASVLGGVKAGSGVSVAGDGTLSVAAYTLPFASASTLGGVKVGSGLSVAGDGTLSIASTGTVNRQFGRYDGTGASGGDNTTFILTSVTRTRGSGIIRANQIATPALRNEFEALVNCWFHFSAGIAGNSTHGYTYVRLTKAAGGTEQLGLNEWHEGSTMGYSYSGQTFMLAGDKVSFFDEYTPTQPTSSFFSFVAEQD